MEFTIGQILFYGDDNFESYFIDSFNKELYPCTRDFNSQQGFDFYYSIVIYLDGIEKPPPLILPCHPIPSPKYIILSNLKKEITLKTINTESLSFYKEFSSNILLDELHDDDDEYILSNNYFLKAMIETHLYHISSFSLSLYSPPSIPLFNRAYQTMVSLYRKEKRLKELQFCDRITIEMTHLYRCDSRALDYIDGHLNLFTSLIIDHHHHNHDSSPPSFLLKWRIDLYYSLAKRCQKDFPSNFFYFICSKIISSSPPSLFDGEKRKEIFEESFQHYLSLKGEHPRLTMQMAKMLFTVEESLEKKIKLQSLVVDSYGFVERYSEWSLLLDENLNLLIPLLIKEDGKLMVEHHRPLLIKSLFKMLEIRQNSFIKEFETIITRALDGDMYLGSVNEIFIENSYKRRIIFSSIPIKIKSIINNDGIAAICSNVSFPLNVGGGGKFLLPASIASKEIYLVLLFNNGNEVKILCQSKDIVDIYDDDDDDDIDIDDGIDASIVKTPLKKLNSPLHDLLRNHSISYGGQLVCHRKIINIMKISGGGAIEVLINWTIYNLLQEDIEDLIVEFKNHHDSFFRGMRKSYITLLKKDQVWNTRTRSLMYNIDIDDNIKTLIPTIIIKRMDSLSLIVDLIKE